MVFIGPTSAPRQAALGTSVTLLNGRLRLSAQIDRRSGSFITNYAEVNRCSLFLGNCRAVNDPASSLADQANAVAFNSTRLGNTLFGYIQEASFTRWRELAATLDLPTRLARQVGAQSASLTITGRNLGLFTKYQGLDPETNGSAGLVEGYGGNPTPPPARYWLLRVNLGL